MFLNNSPVLFKSVTQKHVALSVTEAELYAAVNCVQEMIYCKNVLNNIGLQVTVLMVPEVDNKGTVDLINNWSVGGCTRLLNVRQCYLCELKEEGLLVVEWIAVDLNDSDIFTKNLGETLFEKFTPVVYTRVDKYLTVKPE